VRLDDGEDSGGRPDRYTGAGEALAVAAAASEEGTMDAIATNASQARQ